MKVEQGQAPPTFTPIIITLESKEEFFSFVAVSRHGAICDALPALNPLFDNLTDLADKIDEPAYDGAFKRLDEKIVRRERS